MAETQPPYDHDNWAQPAPPTSGRSAAAAVWITAGVQIVLFGLCTSMFVVLGLLSASQLEQIVQDQPQELTADMIQIFARVMAVAVLLFMFLPSVVLGVLGFMVRQGSNAARILAIIILLAQAAILAGLVLLNIVSALLTGQLAIVELAISVVLFGGLIALELWTVGRLMRVRTANANTALSPNDEPWNSHIPRGL